MTPSRGNGREHRRARADDDRAPRRARSAHARRAAPPRSARSAAPRSARRSARESGRASAASARSPARARSRRARARAPPRTPAGTPPSCRSRSRRTGGSSRSPPRRARSTIRASASACDALSAAGSGSPGSASRSAGCARSPRGFRCTGATSCERARRRRAVVVGDPERELDERRRQLLDDALDRRGLDPVRRRNVDLGHDAAAPRVPEPHLDDRARPTSSGTSYVNSRASARAVTSG